MVSPICIFGDSVARGVIFDAALGKYEFIRSGFVTMVERCFQIQVDNFSRFGCTVTKGGILLKRHTPDLGKYKYVALEFGGNDCDYDWSAVAADPETEHLPRTPLPEFEARYSDMIDIVEAGGSRPVLFSLPPVDPDRYFDRISRGLNAQNILRWLGDTGHIYRWHELYNFTVCKLAFARNIPLIDIRRDFLATRNYRTLLCEDGIHPNAAGHALIADVVEQYMRSLA